MKILIILSFVLSINTAICQTYKATYECVLTSTGKIIDDSSETDVNEINIEMKIMYTIIANSHYSYIKAEVKSLNYPLNMDETQEEIFIDYNTNTFYWMRENRAAKYLPEQIISRNINEKSGGYSYEIYSPVELDISHIKLGLSNKIPWYVNPGFPYKQTKKGVVKIHTGKTQISLQSYGITKFNFEKVKKKLTGTRVQKASVSLLRLL
jgi:hypothetical protein